MPYKIRLSNGEVVADIPDGAVDSASTSLSLVGKNLAGYGSYQNTNFVRLLENFSNTIPPDSPTVGQLWFDSNRHVLKIYSSYQTSAPGVTPVTYDYAWKDIGNLISGPTQPSAQSSIVGDMWFNTTTNQLHIFNGQVFDLVSTSIPGFGKSRLEGTIIEGTLNGTVSNVPVLNLFIDNNLIAIISKDNFTPSAAIPGLHNNSENPGLITRGINIVGPGLINGISEQAMKFVDPVDGPLATNSFLRTDVSGPKLIVGGIQVQGLVGAGTNNFSPSPTPMLLAGNYIASDGNWDTETSAMISFAGERVVLNQTDSNNPTVDRDILIIDSSSEKSIVAPAVNLNVDLGSISNKFNNVYSNVVTSNLSGNVVGNVSGNLSGDRVRIDQVQTRDGLSTAIDLTTPTVEFYGKHVGNIESSSVEVTTLTPGRIVFTDSNSVLVDDNKLRFDGTTLTVESNLSVSNNVIINGTLTVTGGLSSSVTGDHKGNIKASDDTVAYNYVTKEFSGSFIGNASTASSLAISRTINGVPFDGSSNIVVSDNTRLSVSGGAITGNLSVSGTVTLTATPTQPYHAVSKAYVDDLIASRPLFLSLDTKGLSVSGTGAGSVVDILNTLIPVSNLAVGAICRVTSTVQNAVSAATTDTRNFIGITYVRTVSVTTTVLNPTRNSNLVYAVNSNKTSWEYVSG